MYATLILGRRNRWAPCRDSWSSHLTLYLLYNWVSGTPFGLSGSWTGDRFYDYGLTWGPPHSSHLTYFVILLAMNSLGHGIVPLYPHVPVRQFWISQSALTSFHVFLQPTLFSTSMSRVREGSTLLISCTGNKQARQSLTRHSQCVTRSRNSPGRTELNAKATITKSTILLW